ncbi:MAG: pyridoxal phosphate-dependent aminotransferase family protein [Spirochaetes bacterium]|nr:pyridoxal phosphate-dependent aminotransferase family protein [Spirochaetota bacterium]
MALDFLKSIYEKKIALSEEISFNPYYAEISSALSQRIIIDGKEFIDLGSNNYLGLADNDYVKQEVKRAVDAYGISMCGTPIATGAHILYNKAVDALNLYTGCEDGLIYPSCYQANAGLFQSLITPRDCVIFDQYVHSSLLEGIKATGARYFQYTHNDCENLRKRVQMLQKFENIFVVTESVFSTEGAVAPVKQIYCICSEYNATMVLDDSHGIGVLGKNGKGILEHTGITPGKNLLYTASLGKALAGLGGYIGGSPEAIQILRYLNPSLIYSTALPPHCLAGIIAALDIMNSDGDSIIQRLKSNKINIKQALVDKSYTTIDSDAPIISVLGGSDKDTLLFAKQLYHSSILSIPFIWPSVAKNRGVIRMIPGAHLNDETVNTIVKRIKML